MSEEHTHEHPHSHADGHPHHHENTRAVLNRMSRAIGHMESIKAMIEDGRDCSEVLIQIARLSVPRSTTSERSFWKTISGTASWTRLRPVTRRFWTTWMKRSTNL